MGRIKGGCGQNVENVGRVLKMWAGTKGGCGQSVENVGRSSEMWAEELLMAHWPDKNGPFWG